MSKELAIQNAVAVREPSLVEIIQQAISTPNFDVGTIERIIALKERMDDQGRRNAFAAAMSRLQSKLPQIDKRGKIMERDSNKVRSTYAKIEDLDGQIRPFLAEEGFAFSYDTQPGINVGEIRILGTMTHCEGHSVTKQIDLPIDTGGAKSKVQERSSTVSVGIRNLLRMHLNLVMREVDDDGQGVADTVSAKDLSAIVALMESTGSSQPGFLAYMKVERLEDIPRRDVPRAMAALKSKIKRPA